MNQVHGQGLAESPHLKPTLGKKVHIYFGIFCFPSGLTLSPLTIQS